MTTQTILMNAEPPLYPESLRHTQIRREILPNREILKPLLILNHQPLLIRQMQQANKAETRRQVRHGLFRVHVLQAVDDICECEGAVDGFGGGVICGGCLGRCDDLECVLAVGMM
jgi:hypothetical protein